MLNKYTRFSLTLFLAAIFIVTGILLRKNVQLKYSSVDEYILKTFPESFDNTKDEPKKEIKQEPKKQEEQKQKAATKIVKKMGDKGRYEANNQLKTLIVMQVLGNSKDFFVANSIPDMEGFFTDGMLPDSVIEDNNLAQYYMMMSNDIKHSELENLQYGRD